MAFIQVPEIARKLQRRLGTDGPAPVHTVGPELVPVVLVEDFTTPTPEDTGFERMCLGYSGIAAEAAKYAHAGIFIPSGSGLVAHVEAAMITHEGAGWLELRTYDAAALSSTGTKAFRDRRITGSPAAVIAGQNNATQLGTFVAAFEVPGDESIQIPIDVVIGDGQGILLTSPTVDKDINAAIYWRERPRLSGE